MRPVLSILIPTLYQRIESYNKLLSELDVQINGILDGNNLVEILHVRDGGEKSTGFKRNILVEQADGEYVTFIDDDDSISETYLYDILQASSFHEDCIAIDGLMTTNGQFPTPFYHTKDANYGAKKDGQGNVIYEKWPTHITPIKRSIAIQIPFPDLYFGEDYQWAKALHESKLIKTEIRIRKPLYFYQYVAIKNLPHGKN